MWRVDPPQHAATLGADKRPDGGVDVGGAALLAVETLLVSSVAGLNIRQG